MNLIRCHKCGAMVISDESLLQNIIDAMEEATRLARNGKPYQRNARLQEAAEYRSIYKGLMHHITERDRAERVTPHELSELIHHVLFNNLMTRAEVDAVCVRGKAIAAAARVREDKEIQRVYGNFETICNRTKPNPTERAALERCK